MDLTTTAAEDADERMDGLELRLLGPLELWRDGDLVLVPAARQRDLLVALALRAGRVVTLERLMRLLWADSPPATARNTLQSVVSRTRRLLPPEVLQSRPGGYLLAVSPERVDVHRFEVLLRAGRDALAGGDPDAAARVLAEALDLWRGPSLVDVNLGRAAAGGAAPAGGAASASGGGSDRGEAGHRRARRADRGADRAGERASAA